MAGAPRRRDAPARAGAIPSRREGLRPSPHRATRRHAVVSRRPVRAIETRTRLEPHPRSGPVPLLSAGYRTRSTTMRATGPVQPHWAGLNSPTPAWMPA